MSERYIMVDTWAWLALYNTADQFHDLATVANDTLLDERRVFVTTNGILSETYTNLNRWASHKTTVEFGQTIQSIARTGALEIIRVEVEDEEDAWVLFEKYDDLKGLSFNDCLTAAVMKRLEISEIFTGDKHFTVMGFVLTP
ncbi:MAG: PIN domain-containing protein [Chloroflexota bacterium]|mgnify:FL=1